MRICFLLGGLTGGGIGRVTSILTNELSKNNEYQIYLLSYSEISNEAYSVPDNVDKSFLLKNRVSMRKAILSGIINKLHKYIKENDIDILVSCGVLNSFISIIACMRTKAKCINWEHSALIKDNHDFKFQRLVRWIAAKNSDLNIVLTRQTQREYLSKYKLCPNKVVQIYNPVDPSAFRSLSYKIDSKKIISVGRLDRQKRLEDAIVAASHVLPLFDGWRWEIYGDGEKREELQKLIDEYKLSDCVVLKGRVPNIYDLYHEYSFIVMTSRYEGFPMTLLEAAANRLPMVSYDIETGPNEIIVNNENGFLIESHNIRDLVNTISMLIQNADFRKNLSEKSFERAHEFEIENIIDNWNKVFRSITFE